MVDETPRHVEAGEITKKEQVGPEPHISNCLGGQTGRLVRERGNGGNKTPLQFSEMASETPCNIKAEEKLDKVTCLQLRPRPEREEVRGGPDGLATWNRASQAPYQMKVTEF